MTICIKGHEGILQISDEPIAIVADVGKTLPETILDDGEAILDADWLSIAQLNSVNLANDDTDVKELILDFDNAKILCQGESGVTITGGGFPCIEDPGYAAVQDARLNRTKKYWRFLSLGDKTGYTAITGVATYKEGGRSLAPGALINYTFTVEYEIFRETVIV